MKRGEYVTPEDSATPAAAPTRKDRPTPSQRTEAAKSTNIVVQTLQNVNQYRKEVADELRKVTWLSREETQRLATIVITVTTISSLFLGAVSYLFGYLTQLIATQGSTIAAGIAAIAVIVIVAGLWLFRDALPGSRIDL
jgi:preprotein translocase SecE subunit